MTEKWVGGICKLTSDWDGNMGCLDFEGILVEVPNALACLSTNLDPRNYDSSGVGPGLDVVEETTVLLNREMTENAEDLQDIEIGKDCVQHVWYLSLAVFRRLLVNHFAILFAQNKIIWPRRNQKPRRRLLLTVV